MNDEARAFLARYDGVQVPDWETAADLSRMGVESMARQSATAPELSLEEAAIVAHFENGEAAPESYVRQHTSEPTCFCGPVQVGTLGVWTHRVVEP